MTRRPSCYTSLRLPLITAIKMAMQWWVTKSHAVFLLSVVTTTIPLFLVPLLAGVSMGDAVRLYVWAGGGASLFCTGFCSLGYLLMALFVGGVKRRPVVASALFTLDVALLSLIPSVFVLFVLSSAERLV